MLLQNKISHGNYVSIFLFYCLVYNLLQPIIHYLQLYYISKKRISDCSPTNYKLNSKIGRLANLILMCDYFVISLPSFSIPKNTFLNMHNCTQFDKFIKRQSLILYFQPYYIGKQKITYCFSTNLSNCVQLCILKEHNGVKVIIHLITLMGKKYIDFTKLNITCNGCSYVF